MRAIDPILMELDQEGQTTRRVLERVPEDKLGWRPHAKSMTLGQLAFHVATTPGNVAEIASKESYEFQGFTQPEPASKAELLKAFEDSLAQAKSVLGGLSDEQAMATWTATKEGAVLMSLPRIGLLRAIQLNHWYHHRGQLTVYLRLLDVPLPSVYGPSADENPFG
ncbi:MAG TPA: DinB family protein [Thermoanaerobaculia bacterium]|nr:DinB family protein [Thermoanaerobaculia bacterium]